MKSLNNPRSYFGLSIDIIHSPFDFPENGGATHCGPEEFFLKIAGVACYRAVGRERMIYIEPDPALQHPASINAWLFGTVFAYLLQYHDYLVLQ